MFFFLCLCLAGIGLLLIMLLIMIGCWTDQAVKLQQAEPYKKLYENMAHNYSELEKMCEHHKAAQAELYTSSIGYRNAITALEEDKLGLERVRDSLTQELAEVKDSIVFERMKAAAAAKAELRLELKGLLDGTTNGLDDAGNPSKLDGPHDSGD
jgi:multidrug resistance efflux pump